MIAGFNAYCTQELGIKYGIGGIIAATVCFVIFNKNLSGIVKINEILVPLIIVLIILLGFTKLNVKNINLGAINSNTTKALLSSIIYSSYNSITLIPMIISLKDYIKQKGDIVKTSILCFFILTILGIAIFLMLNTLDFKNIEIPMVYIAGTLRSSF